jgi:hypothetical protein
VERNVAEPVRMVFAADGKVERHARIVTEATKHVTPAEKMGFVLRRSVSVAVRCLDEEDGSLELANGSGDVAVRTRGQVVRNVELARRPLDVAVLSVESPVKTVEIVNAPRGSPSKSLYLAERLVELTVMSLDVADGSVDLALRDVSIAYRSVDHPPLRRLAEGALGRHSLLAQSVGGDEEVHGARPSRRIVEAIAGGIRSGPGPRAEVDDDAVEGASRFVDPGGPFGARDLVPEKERLLVGRDRGRAASGRSLCGEHGRLCHWSSRRPGVRRKEARAPVDGHRLRATDDRIVKGVVVGAEDRIVVRLAGRE